MEEFTVGPWTISAKRSHILKSNCERLTAQSEKCSDSTPQCNVCLYSKELQLPSLPEMVFPENHLLLTHENGSCLEFNALDALKLVDAHNETMKVAAANEWQSDGLEEVKDKVKPFDWTYTTEYNGTTNDNIEIVETDDGIDYEKLKQSEKIHFFEDIILFEDELADNGISECRVKIRVMASGFFILLRFFLRVDGVLVRMNDTRIYHGAGTDFMIREFSKREAKLPNPRLSLSALKDINRLSEILPHTNVSKHRLLLT